eukprot:Seg72.1 transcript_id=Seg72.1/GoldUCD/mRNA.D3Y31 product="UDP-glucuronosyltransferase 1-4" protein_id=Seg72.1/GoldUCD/D3Y31
MNKINYKICAAAPFAVLLTVINCFSCHGTSAPKVLIYPYDLCPSAPFNNLVKVAKILTEKGYNVTILIVNDLFCASEINTNIHVLHYSAPETVKLPKYEIMHQGLVCDSIHQQAEVTKSMNNLCESLLHRRCMMKQLKSEAFDLFLTDDLNLCGRALADFLLLPTVVWNNCGLDSVFAPSFQSLHTKMLLLLSNFPEKFKFMIQVFRQSHSSYASSIDRIKDSVDLNTSLSISGTYSRVKPLILSNTDFIIENPRPVMPYVIPIVGLLFAKSESLPENVNEFIQNSEDNGIIYVDLGTKLFSHATLEMIAKVLLKFQQKIVWKSSVDILKTDQNIKFVPTVAENDILAHPYTKLWITNCDIESLDSVAHGIPVAVLPLTTESARRCQQMVHQFSTGLALNITHMKEVEVEDLLQEVLHSPTYKENAVKLSNLFKRQMKYSKERFSFWIDFVIHNKGVQHLWNDELEKLRWYEYCMINDAICIICSMFLGLLVLRVCMFR